VVVAVKLRTTTEKHQKTMKKMLFTLLLTAGLALSSGAVATDMTKR
jgi:hypothetical protein